jgi:GTP-binding protein
MMEAGAVHRAFEFAKMKFVDEAIIEVKSGHGGPGCASFRREKFVPKGGPSGGDGGKGGDVILRVDPSLVTLLDFKYKSIYQAKNGEPGRTKDQYGAGGPDLIVRVPAGTSVYDDATGDLLEDLIEPGASFTAARGGKGGLGNIHFKTATNQSPRKAQPGLPGEQRRLRLELKLIADVGLVGLPNAGKSTLISRISAARPKIADYPFTTLTPNLGVAGAGEGRSFVVADLPGLIEGASLGHGLGHQFLRHIERTRLILHLLDCSREKPEQDLKTINAELEAFDPALMRKPQIAVITKTDLVGEPKKIESLRKKIAKKGFETLAVSAVSGKGLDELVRLIADKLKAMKPVPEEEKQEEKWEP